MGKKYATAPPTSAPAQPSDCQASKTSEAVLDYQKAVKEKALPAAQSDETVSKSQLEEALLGLCADGRSLEKAEEIRIFYRNAHFNTAIGLAHDAAAFQKCVDDQSKASEELAKAFSEAVGKLKDTSQKLNDVCRLAKEHSIDVKKTGNVQFKDALEKILGQKDALKDKAEAFETTAENLSDAADQVIETAVKATGAQSFVNVKSLKACADDLKKAADAIKTDTENGLKMADEKVKAALKSLDSDLPKLTDGFFKHSKVASQADGVEAVSNYFDAGLFGQDRAADLDAELEAICDALLGKAPTA